MKTCSKCGKTQPLDEYYRMSASSDGRRAACKTCTRNRDRTYREVNKDAIRARDRDRKRCTYPSCIKTRASDSGLCGAHHTAIANDRESPLALTNGEWVRGPMGVRRWVAA